MDFKIVNAKLKENTIKITRDLAVGIAEFEVKKYSTDRDTYFLVIVAEYTTKGGFRLYRNELKIVEGNSRGINYSVTDKEFENLCKYATKKNILPNISTALQDELYGYSVISAENTDKKIEVKGETASCYVCFDMGDGGVLGMQMCFTEKEGFILDESTFNHVDVRVMATHNESDFFGNDDFFLNIARRTGIEGKLKYALIGEKVALAPKLKKIAKKKKK